MSAICGLYQLDNQRVDTAALGPMMHALKAFGPDGTHSWHSGPVAFGHHQLWVTPESQSEVLPWHDTAMDLALTADARLDDREALATSLGLSPREVATLPDSHLILHAYAKWGTACPDHLLGDFAFAIWDARRQQLFCARDLFGVMPFFYHQSATQFFFASTLEAICAAADITHDIDYGYIAAYFRDAGNPPYTEHTWYTGVRRLFPAHAMTVSAAGVHTWPYWQAEHVPALPPASDAAYIEQLADLLQRAVACRTRTAYSVGAHLSGGLDSSGVTALAARQARQHNLACTAFSWAPPPEGQPEDDERVLVESVRQAEGLCCHYAPGTLADVAATRLRPLHLPARRQYPESQVRRLAQAQGIRVILSGWGGDELAAFNGRGYLPDLWRQGHWRTLWRESAAYARIRGSRPDAILRSKGLYPHLPDRLFQWVTRSEPLSSLKQQFSRSEPVLWHPDFIAQLVESDPGPPERMRRERPGMRRNQLDLLAHGHLTTRTEWWATEAPESGLVYRYPMLDRRLAEFSLGLPPQLFFRDGWSRYILRRALEGIVPPQVQWNWSKIETARGAYFATLEWEWRQQVLKPLVTNVLSSHERFYCLNPARVPVMVKRMRSNPQSGLPVALPLALQAELMMNHPLAMDVQAWLDEQCGIQL